MQFHVISLFPDMLTVPLEQGVVGQAVKKGYLCVDVINPRDFTEDVHKTVDDRPYGGGDGMVMMVEPLKRALESLKSQKGHVVHLSPQGALWNNEKAQQWAQKSSQPVTLICSRYAGVDQRFIERYVDEEISIGDYVLSGGELGALVVVDSVARFLPGVLGNEDSPYKESFANGLLEAPQFTRPPQSEGLPVPQVLLSGNHKKIDEFRFSLSLIRSQWLRPDLVRKVPVQDKQWKKALNELKALSEEELEACGLSHTRLRQVEEQIGL